MVRLLQTSCERLCLIAIGISFGLFISEMFFRACSTPTLGQRLKHFESGNASKHWKRFEEHPVIGFKPIFNSRRYANNRYSKYGTFQNKYEIKKSSERPRILFLGDSVTAAEKVINELKSLYGDNFEYWVAGVPGYTTEQEVAYYFLYCHNINPDHVVLQFHLNDFERVNVLLFDAHGQPQLYQANKPLNFWKHRLLVNSYVFQLLWFSVGDSKLDLSQRASEIKSSLVRLKNHLQSRSIAFTVFVLPYLDHYEKWPPSYRTREKETLRMLNDMRVRFIYPRGAIETAVAQGIQMTPRANDKWHPSQEMAKVLAQNLYENSLLSPLSHRDGIKLQ